jgi:hypothetical protein
MQATTENITAKIQLENEKRSEKLTKKIQNYVKELAVC